MVKNVLVKSVHIFIYYFLLIWSIFYCFGAYETSLKTGSLLRVDFSSMFFLGSCVSYPTVKFCGDYYVLTNAELLLHLGVVNREIFICHTLILCRIFCSSLGGSHILFFKWLCAIWYRGTESSSLFVYPGQHV